MGAAIRMPYCLACGSEHQRRDEAEAVRRHIETLIRANGVPSAMREWSIGTFPLDHEPGRAAAFKAVQAWLREYREGARCNLYLWGELGVGKTWLAVSAARRLCEEGTQAYFVNWRDLLADLRASFREKQKVEGEGFDALERARAASVLVLDELGGERPTAWALEELAGLVQRRSDNRGPIIVTSNFSPESLLKNFGNDLTAGRILDRLLDGAHVHEARGPSYRRGIINRMRGGS